MGGVSLFLSFSFSGLHITSVKDLEKGVGATTRLSFCHWPSQNDNKITSNDDHQLVK